MDLLAGCPYRCRYCYTQSFRSHPAWEKVIAYGNTLELLRGQLARMQNKVGTVYFSTACEPFVGCERVLETGGRGRMPHESVSAISAAGGGGGRFRS